MREVVSEGYGSLREPILYSALRARASGREKQGKGKRGKGKGEVAASKFNSGLFYKAYSPQKCRKILCSGGGST